MVILIIKKKIIKLILIFNKIKILINFKFKLFLKVRKYLKVDNLYYT